MGYIVVVQSYCTIQEGGEGCQHPGKRTRPHEQRMNPDRCAAPIGREKCLFHTNVMKFELKQASAVFRVPCSVYRVSCTVSRRCMTTGG